MPRAPLKYHKENQVKQNTFSIITPVCNRAIEIEDCITSVLRQTYPYWELIIVDDNSNDTTWEVIEKWMKKDKRIKGIRLDKHSQRAKARNAGMKAAKNDWICWLDSDDEYLKTYLEVLNSYMVDDFPGYKCYHYGATVVRMGRQSVRDTFDLKEEGEGMAKFDSGHIGSGSFCFHKDCLKEVGYLPDEINPYLFADVAKKEFPELKEWFGPLYLEGGNSLGNPWGDDYLMFYKITRKFKSKALPIAPYIQFVRRQQFSFQPIP